MTEESTAPAPKRFCKDCRYCQGSDTGDIPLSPFCLRAEAVYCEDDPVTGRHLRKRMPAFGFRTAKTTPAGNVLACGMEARYFEPVAKP